MQGCAECFVFGGLADARFQRDGCVGAILEAKFRGQLTPAHLGELVKYHRLIPRGCRGMLFNERQFWLYISMDGYPVRLVKCTWATPGAGDLIRSFFNDEPPPPPPFVVVLRRLLLTLRLRPAPKDGTAFLGAGASGRVFAVQHNSEEESPHPMALKVVVAHEGWHQDLSREFDALQAASKLGAPVIPVVEGSLQLGDDGGGFLLARCGRPFPTGKIGRTACNDAFAALASLHGYKVLHGDARLPNLLLVDREARWVDLSRASVAPAGQEINAYGMQQDVISLAVSCFRSAGIHLPSPPTSAVQLPSPVTEAIATYDCSSEGSVKELASAVLEAMQSKEKWRATIGVLQ